LLVDTRALFLVFCLLTLAGYSQNQPPGLTVRDGRFQLNGSPYRGVGVNYFDLLLRLQSRPAEAQPLIVRLIQFPK